MNFKRIIISAITASSMLLSTISAPVSAETTTTTNPWAVEKSEGTFRFGVMSDVHVCPDNSNNVQQYMNMGLDAFADMGVDGLALAGDITNSMLDHTSTTVEQNLHTSVLSALDTYKYEIKSEDATKNDISKKPMVYAMGNHEMPANGQTEEGIWAAKQLFVTEHNIDELTTVRTVDGKYTGDYVAQMGGYTFIMSSPNNGLNDAYTESAVNGVKVNIESWVLEQIEAANNAYVAAETPNKPIFYIQHIPVNDHYGRTSKPNTDEFMAELKKYPNVIVLSAHVHNLIEDPRLISQDPGYTSIITGAMATGTASVWGGNIESIATGGDTGIKQQMAIDVTYDDANKESNIKVYRMDVENQEFIGKPYEFTLDGTAPTKYSTQLRYEDEGRSTAAWNEGAALTATAVEGTRNITVTYPTDADSATVTLGDNAEVLQDNFLWGYKIFAVNKATGVADKTLRQAYEFFRTPTVSQRTATFEDLERDQEYEIKAYPITIFQYADTYEELDAADVEALTQTVKTYNVKSASEIAQQMTRNVMVSGSKTATYLQHDGTISALTDGNKYTFADELWINGTTGVGFIIDLERNYKISNINLVAYENNTTSGRNEFVIYGSKDNENWSAIYERTSSDVGDEFGTQAAHTLNCDIDDDYYRYIKIEYLAYALLADIEVYADVPVTNVAYGKEVDDASDTILDYVDKGDFELSNAIDNNNDTAIYSQYTQDTYHYIQINLGKKYPIGMVEYQKRVGNADTNGKSFWKAYGSNSVSDRESLHTSDELDTSIYTALTKTQNVPFDESVDSYAEAVIDENEYQYITVRKTKKNIGDTYDIGFLMGEFRVFVINPEVADFAYTDGTASITFTEAMDFTNANEDITVYDSEGTAKTVTFTPNSDNTAVTFDAESGDKVVVSQDISNAYGIGMHNDEIFEIYDLTVDYSGKTKKKFENVNVAYGKKVTSPTGYESDVPAPAGVPDYYNESQLTNGVQYGLVSALNDAFVIDLGRGYNLNKIVLKIHTNPVYTDQARIHFTLSGSDDGINWTPIHKAPTDAAKLDAEIWNGKVGTFNIDEDVNYRYIKYENPVYFILEEIEAYADVEVTKVTQSGHTVTSSSANLQSLNNLLVDDWPNLTYVDGAGYNWISVEMDKAYPIGMYELYVRDWNESGTHGMDGWRNVHGVKLYGSNEAPVEQLDDNTTNLSVADLTPYGFDVLGDTRSFEPWQPLFAELYPPVYNDDGVMISADSFGKTSIMPEDWIFTNVYRETVNNTTKYKNLTLKKYDGVNKFIEYGEFAAYVLNATVNAVEVDANGVDIHFGDKMVADMLGTDTISLTKDGVAVGFNGSLSENGMVYTLDAELTDGTYTLTVADDVKNVLGVPMQADYTYEFKLGPVYGITTADGGDVTAIAADTAYVVTEPVSGNGARIAIAAIYDAANSMLVASAIENIPADYAKAYAEVEITTPETLPEGKYYVRYFLWSADTLTPVLDESIKVFE